ncbi:cysteine synthase family protein [Helicobacter sp. 11S02596-1]|uniref:PLP-dependent cysteine synthase family protein n=1 Tax=Helicobacter sp. 11S02596-1 TaxID=1476194 RepID=UPI000BA7DBD2|nr:cysteine synthase family protein [Helicobacter sp. 11S02596-1]PAF42365.1 cysteine synthase [Helicobacter sp. 11S02596-1]
MGYCNNIDELIGNTPLLKLNRLDIPNNNRIFAKLEFRNPAGGVKDRVAKFMIEMAEKRGKLKPGSTIIEATAGNTGLGIALSAKSKGYDVVMVVPEKFSIEKQTLMKALGAKVINTPKDEGIEGANKKVATLLEIIPDSICLSQFDNPDNPKSHYESTAREIDEALDGNIDYFVCGAGSGGTFSGVMAYFREKIPAAKGVLCDPMGSIIGGGEAGSYDIEGIGNHFVPKIMRLDFIDEVIKVKNENAYEGMRILCRREGVLAGVSSGASLWACLELAKKIGNANIVTIFPDGLEKYLSKDIVDFD